MLINNSAMQTKLDNISCILNVPLYFIGEEQVGVVVEEKHVPDV